MKLIIGIAILLVAVLAFLKWRSRDAVRKDPDATDLSASARLKAGYHAVSIRPGAPACRVARDLEDQRFLSGSAPRIPLAGCDVSDCSCRFAHHDDRRAGDDRRTPYPPSIGLDAGSTGAEQRLTPDRRRGRQNLE
ncbi:MAG TPA: hypothetical protein VMP00_13455 [Burkholderiales bacterium]|nr:hypothetical protein [Burkholderiales bacterium]